MKQLFLLFSHQLTPVQKDELHKDFGINKIVYLPPELQILWSNIPPEYSSIRPHLEDILRWLSKKANPEDVVLIQGEFGAVYMTVDFCKKTGLTPIYATTKRGIMGETLNDETIEVKRTFTHVRFRRFEGWY